MKCYMCGKSMKEKEGFVSNVDTSGKALKPGEEPIAACGESCRAAFESTLHSHGKPLIHMSRVTGYIQIVENWNKGKQQEFFDRKRYSVADL